MPDMSCHRLENLELRSFVCAVLCCVLCSLTESLIQFNDREAWSCHVGILWIIAKYSCEFCLVHFTISPRHLHAYNMKKIQDTWDLVDTPCYACHIYILYTFGTNSPSPQSMFDLEVTKQNLEKQNTQYVWGSQSWSDVWRKETRKLDPEFWGRGCCGCCCCCRPFFFGILHGWQLCMII